MLKLLIRIIGSQDDAIVWLCTMGFAAFCYVALVFGLPGAKS